MRRPAMAAGIWVGLTLAVALLAFAGERKVASDRTMQCVSNAFNLSSAIQMYVTDWERFPSNLDWSGWVSEYTGSKTPVRCPEARGNCSYAYNAEVAGVPASRVEDPGSTVVIFESDAGPNARGGKELLPAIPRHSGGDVVGNAFTDAEWVARKRPASGRLASTRWPQEWQDSPWRW